MRIIEVGSIESRRLNLGRGIPVAPYAASIIANNQPSEGTQTFFFSFWLDTVPEPSTVELEFIAPSECINPNGDPTSFIPGGKFRETERGWENLYQYRGRVFYVASGLSRNLEEEAILRIKKMVLQGDARIKRLRSQIEAMEQSVTHQPIRPPIPDDVKLFVFTRDGGKCVRCGSNINIQFDHIIPFSKGGSGTTDNLQIMCEHCNLEKSDSISF